MRISDWSSDVCSSDLGALLPQQRGILQAADLVAYAGGVFELQVAGVLVHLLLQRLEPGHGLGGVHRRVILGLLGDLALPAADLLLQRRLAARAVPDVDDVLAPRLRRYPVLGVVLATDRSARRGRVCHYVTRAVGAV